MFDDHTDLTLSIRDLKVMENALSTQQKILSVQAGAGSKSARNALTEVKALSSRVKQQIELSGGSCKARFSVSCWLRTWLFQPRTSSS